MAGMTKEQRLKELYKDEVMESVIKILKDLGWECGLDEDGNIVFCLADTNSYSDEVNLYFNNACFYITYDDSLDYIEIYEYCWKKVKIDEYEKVLRLKWAINKANFGSNVTTYSYINEEEQTMDVESCTTLPYLNDEFYLKEFIDKKLRDIFC